MKTRPADSRYKRGSLGGQVTGNDVLNGGGNADTFVFENNSFGNDTISDFDFANSFEKIDLSDVVGIANFADVIGNHSQDVTNGMMISIGANSILLVGVSLGDLSAGDFIF